MRFFSCKEKEHGFQKAEMQNVYTEAHCSDMRQPKSYYDSFFPLIMILKFSIIYIGNAKMMTGKWAYVA